MIFSKFVKYILIIFVSFCSALLSLGGNYYIGGMFAFILMLFLLSRYWNFFAVNLLFLVIILSQFSDDVFILKMTGERHIYGMINIWKFNIFEWWVFGLFLLFVISHLHKHLGDNENKRIQMGPLRPLFLFTFLGLILGVIGTVSNNGEFGFNQIRPYIEGMLLYLIVVNLDMRKIDLKKTGWFLLVIVTLKSIYHLFLYATGKGFYFGAIGYITMGYGDILQNLAIVCLLTTSILVFSKVTNRERVLFVGSLIINLLVILLSLRRSYMLIYFIGLGVFFVFAQNKYRIKGILLAASVLIIIPCVLTVAGKKDVMHKVLGRIDSINVFKYRDDETSSLTSSSGHVSEFMNGWKNVKQHIIMGKGFGVEIEKKTGWKNLYMGLHNELFFYWIRMGIFGMLMFFVMYLIPIKFCWTSMHDPKLLAYKWLFLGSMSFFIAKFFLGGIFYPPIGSCYTKSYVFFILAGFIMNKYLLKNETR